jgi:hypothetical protein
VKRFRVFVRRFNRVVDSSEFEKDNYVYNLNSGGEDEYLKTTITMRIWPTLLLLVDTVLGGGVDSSRISPTPIILGRSI